MRLEIDGGRTIRCTWLDCMLLEGNYSLEAWLKRSGEAIDQVVDVARFEVVQGDVHGTGKVQQRVGFFEGRSRWEGLG